MPGRKGGRLPVRLTTLPTANDCWSGGTRRGRPQGACLFSLGCLATGGVSPASRREFEARQISSRLVCLPLPFLPGLCPLAPLLHTVRDSIWKNTLHLSRGTISNLAPLFRPGGVRNEQSVISPQVASLSTFLPPRPKGFLCAFEHKGVLRSSQLHANTQTALSTGSSGEQFVQPHGLGCISATSVECKGHGEGS